MKIISDTIPEYIYVLKVKAETLEKDVKYVQD